MAIINVMQKQWVWGFLVLGLLISFPIYIFGTEDISLAEKSTQNWKEELFNLGLSSGDVELKSGWEVDHSIESIENLFKDPLQTTLLSSEWIQTVKNSTSTKDLMAWAMKVLDLKKSSSNFKKAPIPSVKSPPSLPKELQIALTDIAKAFNRAQHHLNKSVDSLSEFQRNEFLRINEVPRDSSGVIQQEISSRVIKETFSSMDKFDQTSLFNAGLIISEAAELLIQKVQESPLLKIDHMFSKVEWPTSAGNILVSGTKDEIYSAEEIADKILILDLGGKNTYLGPVAGANENQIRILMDWGTETQITSPMVVGANTASGIFGIGMAFLLNPEGLKKINSDSFSQGCGLAGIGILQVKGQGQFNGGRNTQGFGHFGLGIFQNSLAHHSSMSATKQGQGAGFARGIGVFEVQGDNVSVKGGLVQPDPREPLGSVSICQGVGFGRRAYTGGGVGMALLTGDNIDVEGSYFSQGCGYWHGLGIFQLEGNTSKIQARRYDQGTGVHYAFGHFQVLGSKNRILNWGVGPAFGWDHSLGTALIQGNQNEIQAEWGTGTASIGSWSFSRIMGNENIFQLPSFGSGGFNHDEPSFSVHIIEGKDNRQKYEFLSDAVRHRLLSFPTGWGITQLSGVQMDPHLSLTPPVWRELERESSRIRQMVDLQSKMEDSQEKPVIEKLEGLLDVAAAFSVDKNTPREAIKKLLMIPADEVSGLVKILDPIAVDQLIKIRMALVGHSDDTAISIMDQFEDYPLRKQVNLIHILGYLKPSLVVPFLLSQWEAKFDSILKASLISAMGTLLNEDTGIQPGIRASLSQLRQAVLNPTRKNKKKAVELLQRLNFMESLGLLGTIGQSTKAHRERLLDKGPEDLTETLGTQGAQELLNISLENKKTTLLELDQEFKFINTIEPQIRQNLYQIIRSTNIEEAGMAVRVLGKLGRGEDAVTIEPLLKEEKSSIKIVSIVALHRLGPSGMPYLLREMEGPTYSHKKLILASLPQAVHRQAENLILTGLKDSEPKIRVASITALKNLPPILKPRQKKLIKQAQKILKGDTHPDIQFALKGLR